MNESGCPRRYGRMRISILLATVPLLAAGFLFAAPPVVIDDLQLTKNLADGIGAFADAKTATNGEALVKQLQAAPASAAITLPTDLPPAKTYEDRLKSVFVIGSVYKCGKCEHWHPRGVATAWCLTRDGLMVTNYHVFEKASGDSWGVCGADGKVYRVTGIVAADKSADAAVFRVDAKGLVPLALGGDAPVGEPVSIISHPDGRLFFQTSGEVARYAKAPRRKGPADTIWMDVTAEYAKGSSGGPVTTREGRVVGMVSNTQSVQYGPPGKKGEPTGPHQMVIRNCVPVSAIRALTTGPAKDASGR